MSNINYYQVQEMTPEETRKMLMKCKKAELVSMLMEVHRLLDQRKRAQSMAESIASALFDSRAGDVYSSRITNE